MDISTTSAAPLKLSGRLAPRPFCATIARLRYNGHTHPSCRYSSTTRSQPAPGSPLSISSASAQPPVRRRAPSARQDRARYKQSSCRARYRSAFASQDRLIRGMRRIHFQKFRCIGEVFVSRHGIHLGLRYPHFFFNGWHPVLLPPAEP